MLNTSTLYCVKRAEQISVPHIGEIGAGQVVEFHSHRREFISLPSSETKKVVSQGIVAGRVSGNSLRDAGIDDGDGLICRTIFESDEVRNGKLVVAQTPWGCLVKFIYFGKNEIILRSANPAYEDLYLEPDDVKINAIVIETKKFW